MQYLYHASAEEAQRTDFCNYLSPINTFSIVISPIKGLLCIVIDLSSEKLLCCENILNQILKKLIQKAVQRTSGIQYNLFCEVSVLW